MKLNHIAIPYLAVLAFMFGSILANGGIAWYHTLTLPAWHLEEGVIALIWAVIYVCAAWSLLIVWNKTPHDKYFAWIMGGFALGTLVNLIWSIIFFHLHLFTPSVWCAGVLGSIVVILGLAIYPRSPKAALLLVPYAAWVFFAAYLNHVVSLLNS